MDQIEESGTAVPGYESECSFLWFDTSHLSSLVSAENISLFCNKWPLSAVCSWYQRGSTLSLILPILELQLSLSQANHRKVFSLTIFHLSLWFKWQFSREMYIWISKNKRQETWREGVLKIQCKMDTVTFPYCVPSEVLYLGLALHVSVRRSKWWPDLVSVGTAWGWGEGAIPVTLPT